MKAKLTALIAAGYRFVDTGTGYRWESPNGSYGVWATLTQAVEDAFYMLRNY